MARYFSEQDLLKTYYQQDIHIAYDLDDLEEYLRFVPTADVVPKSEVDRLEYTLLGVMHSVDKWLDGEELEQDEVNRAATMREKTLRIIENTKKEVAREIFAEIEGAIYSNNILSVLLASDRQSYEVGIVKGKVDAINEVLRTIDEIKKKYTEGEV